MVCTLASAIYLLQCLNCRGELRGLNPPTVPPLAHCQSMSWGSAIYYIHTIYITVLVGPPTVEKFNPQLIFHNSNTDLLRAKACVKSIG